jgi:hypothetical protein
MSNDVINGRFLSAWDSPRTLTATLNRLARWGNNDTALLCTLPLTEGERVKRKQYPTRPRVSQRAE